MSLVIAILIVVAATAVAIAAMLLVRRHAPDGSYFNDGDRAAGVFGVLATGFAVLLGFVVFLAFTSYDAARAGAETEALTVAQQVETAQFFPPAVAGELTGELVCYARSVAGVQWERMEAGTLGEQINPWAVELFRTLRTVEPQTATEQSAYDKWLDQTSAREEARNDRIHGAVGVIPTPLWLVLFFSAGADLRVHAVLRRQRRAGGRPGAADRHGGRGDHGDAAAAQLPRQPVPRRRRRPPPGGDGADAGDHRPGADDRRPGRRRRRATPAGTRCRRSRGLADLPAGGAARRRLARVRRC